MTTDALSPAERDLVAAARRLHSLAGRARWWSLCVGSAGLGEPTCTVAMYERADLGTSWIGWGNTVGDAVADLEREMRESA